MPSRLDPSAELTQRSRTWLVTGAAGFIGSHLVERLLAAGQAVRGLDDFSTGSRANIEEVRTKVGPRAWRRFELVQGDVRDLWRCHAVCRGVELVLHQAALGSVLRSIEDPRATHAVNVDGFLNLGLAARDAGCRVVVYASSSSVYGDQTDLPKREDLVGAPLSPYALSKRVDELYADVLQRTFEISMVGLRYFNVFGPRQASGGAYAAVIPRWIEALLRGERPPVFGDGEASRDFCPVQNVVDANLRAALAPRAAAATVYNIALGERTTLNQLFAQLRDGLAARGFPTADLALRREAERSADVRHSLADIARARTELGFEPEVSFADGLHATLDWFAARAG